ncbi:MAG: methyltransferase domain-containing protein, partial [Dehalococcoidia bacterium]
AKLNKEKWDVRAKTFDERRFNYFRYMQKRLVSLLNLKENQRLLDLGCGTGWAVRYAARLVNERGEFYGIDISSNMVEKAKTSSADYKNVQFYQASADRLPFGNDFFDFIICSNSFHHYFSPDKVLNEAYRVLKPKGRIYIMDLTSDGAIAKMIDRWIRRREREHVKFYSTLEYQTMFREAGINYVAGKVVAVAMPGFAMKVHIGEKITKAA